jgi:hypothetical protein
MPDKEIEATLGPYRGQRLTMSDADAGAAIAANWAIDPFVPPPEPPPEPLTEAEREAAIGAAVAWQTAQLQAAAGEQSADPPEGGETRTMSADTPGRYKTRHR